jgi:hypothetical protein
MGPGARKLLAPSSYHGDTLVAMIRNLARLVVVVAAAVAAVASAGSNSSRPAATYDAKPPPPKPMDPSAALGLWKSSFGAVKLEQDGATPERVHGVWAYDRNGEEIIGYFTGGLRGNVLEFRWQEPGLAGAGYLVFDTAGQQFTGRWWTQNRDRTGEWTGWRHESATAAPPDELDPYEPPPE